jgi:transposase
MDSKAFYTRLLGIHDPWYITEVSMDERQNKVDVFIEHRAGVRFPCPACQAFCGIYDHTEERAFRHLNTCQMTTWLHFRIPRVKCKDHGVQQIEHGMAEKNGTTTYEFEALVLDVQQECSITSTCRLLDMDWHTGFNIQQRAVERGFERKPVGIPARIGVDEKSFAKGHKYETLVYDIDQGVVEHVGDYREQKTLESYYARFNKEQLGTVKSVSMDMWDPYIAATRAYIPDADQKIVFDRFHVMRHILKAVDEVRKKEHKVLQGKGDSILSGSKYLWLWSKENLPKWRQAEFNELRSKDLKVSRAWAIKENLRRLWDYRYTGCMRRFFKDWYFWATHSRLDPVIKAAKTIHRYFGNIVTYSRHRVTNALGESLNAKIEKVKRLACGFRNREHYRTAIYFHCGGLDMYPRRSNIFGQIINPKPQYVGVTH